MSTPKVSLIILTYNWPDALLCILKALNDQTCLDFEVIVADDGSTASTQEAIAHFKARYPLRHVWQEDIGFRIASIRNKAVAQAHAPYLIFLDGDCIPPPRFIENHLALQKKGTFVPGQRVLLSPSFTADILKKSIDLHTWNFWALLKARLQKKMNKALPLLYLPLGFLRDLTPRRWKNAKTANLALWRSDFIAVNGFDESFTGWGYEDSDLLTRLLKINVHRRIGAYSTFIFHLHHEIRSRDQASSNWNRLQDQMASARILATLGVDQYLPPRPSIGVAMIVKNEAHRLDRSLRSAQFADQISVVVDESTTDDSIGIAKKYTSLVISSPWLGFGAQKNLAISKLATDWILLLDADEVISPALATEILSVIRDQKQAYFLMRHSYYLNQAIHYGDAKNDRVLRLFPRGEGHVEDTLVHEKVISTLPTATLLNPLFHYTIDRIEEFQAKCESYSTLGAQKAFQSGKSANFVSMWTHSIGCFVRGYFFRGGFLDGKTGFLIAYFNAYGTFLKYQKLIKLGKAR